jgi:hypothetical protein
MDRRADLKLYEINWRSGDSGVDKVTHVSGNGGATDFPHIAGNYHEVKLRTGDNT